MVNIFDNGRVVYCNKDFEIKADSEMPQEYGVRYKNNKRVNSLSTLVLPIDTIREIATHDEKDLAFKIISQHEGKAIQLNRAFYDCNFLLFLRSALAQEKGYRDSLD